MKSTTFHCRRAPAFSLLTLALLGAMAMPAWAADPECVDANGNPVPGNTDQANEGGTDNATCNVAASAYGYANNASGVQSNAFGAFNTASSGFAGAFGYANNAFGLLGSAFGVYNVASGENSSAFGYANTASALSSVAMGNSSVASNLNSAAVGTWYDDDFNGEFDAGADVVNTATGQYSGAFGVGNTASGYFSQAFGVLNTASGGASVAMGFGNDAVGANTTAVGLGNTANGNKSSAFGYQSVANGVGSVALSGWIDLDGDGQFDHAKAGAKVPAGLADGADHFGAQFVGQLAQLSGRELAQVVGGRNRVEQGSGRIWAHRKCLTQMK